MTEDHHKEMKWIALTRETMDHLAKVSERLLMVESSLQSQYQLLSQLNDRVHYLTNLHLGNSSSGGSRKSSRGRKSDSPLAQSPGG